MKQKFSVNFEYPVYFTEGVFVEENLVLRSIMDVGDKVSRKVLFVVDNGVVDNVPGLQDQIAQYARTHRDVMESVGFMIVFGGEHVKNDLNLLLRILQEVNDKKVCRHSYIVGIGGGAVLDLVGFAAAIAHRGIRHIRIPTTVLSQNDSGIGVKNGINAFGKKNFIGTFAPPYAVINDHLFLEYLHDRDWVSGIAEAIKVALIKDQMFFDFLVQNADNLKARELSPMKELVKVCAELHMAHIRGADPFETGSSRPLDFGHWSAHKIEQLTDFEVKHGEAVAIGIALDCIYSKLIGILSEDTCQRVIDLLNNVGFSFSHLKKITPQDLLKGLEEFREHLGGKLTIMLLTNIGVGQETNDIDEGIMVKAYEELTNIKEHRLDVAQ